MTSGTSHHPSPTRRSETSPGRSASPTEPTPSARNTALPGSTVSTTGPTARRVAGRLPDARPGVAAGALDAWYQGGPLALWRMWADDVRGRAVEGGHVFPEADPDATADALASFYDLSPSS